MLRCQPSQIAREPSEVTDWERRELRAESWQRALPAKKAIRLQAGPRRSTKSGLVQGGRNGKFRQADSRSSEIELCGNLNDFSTLQLALSPDPDPVNTSGNIVEADRMKSEKNLALTRTNLSTHSAGHTETGESETAYNPESRDINQWQAAPVTSRQADDCYPCNIANSRLEMQHDELELPARWEIRSSPYVASTNVASGSCDNGCTRSKVPLSGLVSTTCKHSTPGFSQNQIYNSDVHGTVAPGSLYQPASPTPPNRLDIKLDYELSSRSLASERIAGASAQSNTINESRWMRDSPLDELTRCLDRALASQPCSADRRTGSKSPVHYISSLLAGDPFGQNFGYTSGTAHEYCDCVLDVPAAQADTSVPYPNLTLEEEAFVDLQSNYTALIEPTDDSSHHAGISHISETPAPTRHPQALQKRSPHLAQSLTPSCNESFRFATPSIPIYDDNLPSEIQPQTPADIYRSSRRDRRRTHAVSGHNQARSRNDIQTTISSSSENNIHDGFRDAQSDHRTWTYRQESGSL